MSGTVIGDVVMLADGTRCNGIVTDFDSNGWPLVAWPDGLMSTPVDPESLVCLYPAEADLMRRAGSE